MARQPVIVGVDLTPAGVLAANVGCAVARAARVSCHLVHAVREPAGLPQGDAQSTEGADALERYLEATRSLLTRDLAPHVPPDPLERLDVRIGNPAWVLRQVAREMDARLLVLGGKHHPAAVRWFGGSTAHHVVRTVDVPLLVAAAPVTRFERLLVATDLSESARSMIQAAWDFGLPFGARLRVLTVVEPFPAIPDVGIQLNESEHLRHAQQEVEELVASMAARVCIESTVQLGSPARTISEDAKAWGADLVVVGSHGRGWVDRVLLGSTTERLLNRLPCSVLVVPVRGPGSTGAAPTAG
jgi:nucleotide-binding universal stress UspA family protein